MTWYNENDPTAARWLTELAARRLIESGAVETRSVEDLAPSEVPDRAHFFAGIGGWARALDLAGWPRDYPIWTGSCPCQPFSIAGKRRGTNDSRHLWPAWFRLIAERRPSVVVGEQVASPDGRAWLDSVFADLEGAGYACGAANLSAAGIGAPHIRQRLYWVAVAGGQRRQGFRLHLRGGQRGDAISEARWRREAGRVGDSSRARREGRAVSGTEAGGPRAGFGARYLRHESLNASAAGATRGFWSPADWVYCRDAVYRPVEPGAFPLVDGLPRGMATSLRGYGNAIVPQLAATFLEAVADIIGGEG